MCQCNAIFFINRMLSTNVWCKQGTNLDGVKRAEFFISSQEKEVFLFVYDLFTFHLLVKPSCDTRFQRAFTQMRKCAFAFSKKLRWFEPTKVIFLKAQQHAVNSRWKRVCNEHLDFSFLSIQLCCLTKLQPQN